MSSIVLNLMDANRSCTVKTLNIMDVNINGFTVYSTLFKIQERKSDRRSKEIEQRKESQNKDGHVTLLH